MEAVSCLSHPLTHATYHHATHHHIRSTWCCTVALIVETTATIVAEFTDASAKDTVGQLYFQKNNQKKNVFESVAVPEVRRECPGKLYCYNLFFGPDILKTHHIVCKLTSSGSV